MDSRLKDCALRLAESHMKVDPKTEAVFYIPHKSEIRLIEVSDSVGTTGSVLPVRYGADPEHGIAFPSAVILLSPEEWDWVKDRKLKLPQGWTKWIKLQAGRAPRGRSATA